MSSATHRSECTAAEVLYVALELSRDEWLWTMSTGVAATRLRLKVRPSLETVTHALRTAKRRLGVAADAPVRSCYEAGREGFWPHRLLSAVGVSNLVVDSSSIEVSRRARHAKTDRLDGEKLLRLLLRHWGGERGCWHVVHVPTPAMEDARHASRAMTTLQTERTRYRNRLHSLLALHGVRLRIDRRFPQRLADAVDWAGEALGAQVQARVLETWRLLQGVETERRTRRALEQQRATVAPAPALETRVHRLVRLKAVAARTATILVDELFNRELRNRRQVGALSGLVSTPRQSGDRQYDAGLSRSGVPAIRRVAVEIARSWLRYQPTSALTQWYQRHFGGGGPGVRRLGIVALARRLLIALWHYVDHDVLPEGAMLKA